MLCTSAPGPRVAPTCWQFLPPSFNLMGCHHYPASCPMPKTRSAIITPFLLLFLLHHHARSILTYKSVSISVPVSLCLCPHPGPCYPNPSIVFLWQFPYCTPLSTWAFFQFILQQNYLFKKWTTNQGISLLQAFQWCCRLNHGLLKFISWSIKPQCDCLEIKLLERYLRLNEVIKVRFVIRGMCLVFV